MTNSYFDSDAYLTVDGRPMGRKLTIRPHSRLLRPHALYRVLC